MNLKQTNVLKRNELHTHRNVYVPWTQIITKLFVRCVIKLLVKPRNYLCHNINPESFQKHTVS